VPQRRKTPRLKMHLWRSFKEPIQSIQLSQKGPVGLIQPPALAVVKETEILVLPSLSLPLLLLSVRTVAERITLLHPHLGLHHHQNNSQIGKAGKGKATSLGFFLRNQKMENFARPMTREQPL
jgi:hypothetical protein